MTHSEYQTKPVLYCISSFCCVAITECSQKSVIGSYWRRNDCSGDGGLEGGSAYDEVVEGCVDEGVGECGVDGNAEVSEPYPTVEEALCVAETFWASLSVAVLVHK